MKTLDLGGITYLEPMENSEDWRWGTDYTHGDLYEAEALFRDGYRIRGNRLVLVSYPDGEVFEPIAKRDGQYFGKPAFYENAIYLLYVDFPAEAIVITRFDPATAQTQPFQTLPLSVAADCYNLALDFSPMMLTREKQDLFQILWPERRDFRLEQGESFYCRDGEKLYFWKWFEDPDYREELFVRDYESGELLSHLRGNVQRMPNGETWLLKS